MGSLPRHGHCIKTISMGRLIMETNMKKMHMKKSGNNGFTLVEVMVVIVIIGILAAVVIPNFVQTLPLRKVKKAARDLTSYMQNARLQAIKRNTNVRINFTFSPDTYQGELIGPDSTWDTADDFDLSAPVNLADYGHGVAFGFGSATQDWATPAVALNAGSHQAVLEYNNQGMVATTGSNYLDNRDNTICFAITTSLVGGKKLRFYNGMGNWSE